MPIAYMFDEEVGLFHYGPRHPMKPFRIAVTHSLVRSFGLDKKMTVLAPQTCPLTYHPKDYLDGLGTNETSDCPNFIGLPRFCELYGSASISSAMILSEGVYDTVINWSGGLHHAHKSVPSGFCHVNDIVMAILELLKTYRKVMYIDIDVHHGDGVEEAFLECDRVLSLSLHKYGDGFFPETGTLITTPHRAVNVPLLSGIDDASYKYVFEPIIDACTRKFAPDVIVLQCGADSLGGDRLGCFNLSIGGHASCVRYVKSLGIPLLVLGGGGYTLTNVARCWAYETAVLCGEDPASEIPEDNPFYTYFSPTYTLDPVLRRKYLNRNDKEYLDTVMSFVLDKVGKF
ncbi:histone deacetylase [Ordospora pajunii]|uniref:histone deacetylase n=1 Tax=Ordospora pajunii TaxID=3039483 RepID=UPI00295268B0|nr:histone deacetylase [Ordospora pajunii]KAH9410801.1 histone deacetylase [Ordospora pajunii]